MASSSKLMQFINSPTGPKTTHFWGPVANWGFVLAVSDASLRRAAEMPSGKRHSF